MSGDVLSTGSMGGFSTALGVAGVVASTLGSYKKSSSDAAAYEYQSKIAANNAMLAEWQESDARRRGDTTQNIVRQRGAQMKGTQQASMAARGLDLGEGSPLNILTDTDFMTARDVATVQDNTNKEVYALQIQAANYTSNSQMLQMRANTESPWMAAGGTLLTGATSVASGWYSRNRMPTYPSQGDGLGSDWNY